MRSGTWEARTTARRSMMIYLNGPEMITRQCVTEDKLLERGTNQKEAQKGSASRLKVEPAVESDDVGTRRVYSLLKSAEIANVKRQATAQPQC